MPLDDRWVIPLLKGVAAELLDMDDAKRFEYAGVYTAMKRSLRALNTAINMGGSALRRPRTL